MACLGGERVGKNETGGPSGTRSGEEGRWRAAAAGSSDDVVVKGGLRSGAKGGSVGRSPTKCGCCGGGGKFGWVAVAAMWSVGAIVPRGSCAALELNVSGLS